MSDVSGEAEEDRGCAPRTPMVFRQEMLQILHGPCLGVVERTMPERPLLAIGILLDSSAAGPTALVSPCPQEALKGPHAGSNKCLYVFFVGFHFWFDLWAPFY